MNKVLTISIAAYHVEKYLDECLRSFLIHEDIRDSIEVLVINDGSGEGVNAIARKYEEKYPEVFRLIDKENGGHGSTVNRGIEEAAGKYFKTVDGDDWVRTAGLEKLVRGLMETDADLAVTDYEWFQDGSGEILNEIHYDFPGRAAGRIYSFDEVCAHHYINMHGAAFRTDIWKKLERRLDEKCFYVDAEYMLYPIPKIETVVFFPEVVYMYRQGMTTQSMDIRNMQKNCGHHEKVLAHLLEFYDECRGDITEEKKRYIESGIARILVSQIKIYLSCPAEKKRKKQIVELDKRMKRQYPAVYKSVANSAVRLLRLSGYLLYPLACAMCRRAYGCGED